MTVIKYTRPEENSRTGEGLQEDEIGGQLPRFRGGGAGQGDPLAVRREEADGGLGGEWTGKGRSLRQCPVFGTEEATPASLISRSQQAEGRAIIIPVGPTPFADELAQIPEDAIWNGWFESGDAELYYALLRRVKPARVIEIGCGFSSSFAAHALQRNQKGQLIAIDPEPRTVLPEGVRHLVACWQEVDRAVFAALAPGDVLFIDSSHDFEEALAYYPLLDDLQAGVFVHHHDILYPRPFTFPDETLMISYYALRRQRWEGLVSLSLLHDRLGERFQKLFPSSARTPWRSPGSTWLRKRIP
jgi:SAM-dependent methyltransferase